MVKDEDMKAFMETCLHGKKNTLRLYQEFCTGASLEV